MAYVDSFVTPVPKRRLAAYRTLSRKFAKVWRDHGALSYRECVADDVKWGKRTSFPRAVKMKPGETVLIAFVAYKSRAHRDSVNARAMKDRRVAALMNPKTFPLDMKRMFFGGFKVFVDL